GGPALTHTAMERLLRSPWPGNVRELENAMERAAILAQADTIEPGDLPPHVTASLTLGPAPRLGPPQTLAETERILIMQTLERSGWNHSRAAESLGIGRTTLWRKRKEDGIENSPRSSRSVQNETRRPVLEQPFSPCAVQPAALPRFCAGIEYERPSRMAAILVVDDEYSARTTLALLLRHRGHVVQEADG